MTEANDTGGTATFGSTEAPLPVADGDPWRHFATGVLALLVTTPSHGSDGDEEVVGDAESIHAHLRRSAEAHTTISDLEAHTSEAVVAHLLVVRCRLVVR